MSSARTLCTGGCQSVIQQATAGCGKFRPSGRMLELKSRISDCSGKPSNNNSNNNCSIRLASSHLRIGTGSGLLAVLWIGLGLRHQGSVGTVRMGWGGRCSLLAGGRLVGMQMSMIRVVMRISLGREARDLCQRRRGIGMISRMIFWRRGEMEVRGYGVRVGVGGKGIECGL